MDTTLLKVKVPVAKRHLKLHLAQPNEMLEVTGDEL
jgi:hypothetical protein